MGEAPPGDDPLPIKVRCMPDVPAPREFTRRLDSGATSFPLSPRATVRRDSPHRRSRAFYGRGVCRTPRTGRRDGHRGPVDRWRQHHLAAFTCACIGHFPPPPSPHPQPAIRDSIVSACSSYRHLRPALEDYVHNDGTSQRLIRLRGTLPVPHGDSIYHIPLAVWLPESYPRDPPTCFVTPTERMEIAPRHPWVGPGGDIGTPALREWQGLRKPAALREALDEAIAAFSQHPPLYAIPEERGAVASGSQPPRDKRSGPADNLSQRHHHQGSSRACAGESDPVSYHHVRQHPPTRGGRDPGEGVEAFSLDECEHRARDAERRGWYLADMATRQAAAREAERSEAARRSEAALLAEAERAEAERATETVQRERERLERAERERELEREQMRRELVARRADRLGNLVRQAETIVGAAVEAGVEAARRTARADDEAAARAEADAAHLEEMAAKAWHARQIADHEAAALQQSSAARRAWLEAHEEAVTEAERAPGSFAPRPLAPLDTQLAEASAADAACEDCLDALDHALEGGAVTPEAWLRAVRTMARDQYLHRATVAAAMQRRAELSRSGG